MLIQTIEDNLKAYLINPMRVWPEGYTPAITNYNDLFSASIHYKGINIRTADVSADPQQLLGEVDNWKVVTVTLEFYTRNLGKSKPFLQNQQNIIRHFGGVRNNIFYGAQFVKLEHKDGEWQMENVDNSKDDYSIYGGDSAPEIGKEYYGYRLKREGIDYFLYRIPATRKNPTEQYRIFDLVFEHDFLVPKFSFSVDGVNIKHNGDSFFYEFDIAQIFSGGQFIQYENTYLDYVSEDYSKGQVVRSDVTLTITDYSEDEPLRETESEVSNTHPHPNTGITLIARADGEINKVNNYGPVQIPLTIMPHYQEFLVSQKINNIHQPGGVFGNVFRSYEERPIEQIDGENLYVYRKRSENFANLNLEYFYSVEKDDSPIKIRWAVKNDRNFNNSDYSGAIDIDPSQRSYDLVIDDENKYLAIATTQTGQIKIRNDTKNIRGLFTPYLNQPMEQIIIDGLIYNTYISEETFDVFGTFTLVFT